MALIKIKRGQKSNLPSLNPGEPAFTTDEKELYIGSSDGNVKLTSNSEVQDLTSKAHTHTNKSIIDTITSALISNWNSAVTHISDAVKHITSAERSLWNTVSNKVDKESGKGLSSNDFTSTYKSKLDGITSSATNVQKSSTNGSIVINGSETAVYTHPAGTNPHGTTKSDVGLGSVNNWGASSSISANSTSEYATTNMVAQVRAEKANASHTHNYAGSSSAGGAANSAVKLQTARTINGVSFDGSGNITVYDSTKYPHTKYTSTSDVNNIKTTGIYSCAVAMTNAATSTHGTLIVDFNVGTPYQIWIPDNSNTHYKRSYNTSSSSWNAWGSTLANSISGNAATATKLGTARGLTVGNTKKTFDGSADVSWSLSEIGAAASSHTHNYAGSSSAGGAANSALACTGNSATATKLATARTINGTNFDGTGAITTANWGTARTLTIGNSGKSVNGSGNVSWSLSEIGAAASSHTHTSIQYVDLSSQTVSLNDYTLSSGNPHIVFYRCPTDGGGSNITGRPDDNNKYAFSLTVELIRWASTTDYITKQTYIRGNEKIMYVRYCTSGSWSAWEKIYTSVVKPSAADIGAAASSHTHNYAGSSSAGGAATTALACSGNASTSTKLQTARGLTIGNTKKTFDGSADVSWSLSEIGAAASSHSHNNMLNFKSNHVSDWTTASVMQDKTYMGGWHGALTSGTKGYISLAATGSSSLDLMIDGDIFVNETKKVYSEAYKPTPADIGAAASSHSHSTITYSNNKVQVDQPNDYAGLDKKNNVNIDTWYGFSISNKCSGQTVAVDGVAFSVNARDGKVWSKGTMTAPSFSGSLSGNASTATKLQTARGLTIGNTKKTFDGSADVSWSLSEIGAAASSHTHNYVPTSTGSAVTIHADSDASSTSEYLLLKAGHNELKIMSSAGGGTVTKGQDKLTFNGNVVYHAGKKPTPSEIGAMPKGPITWNNLKGV